MQAGRKRQPHWHPECTAAVFAQPLPQHSLQMEAQNACQRSNIWRQKEREIWLKCRSTKTRCTQHTLQPLHADLLQALLQVPQETAPQHSHPVTHYCSVQNDHQPPTHAVCRPQTVIQEESLIKIQHSALTEEVTQFWCHTVRHNQPTTPCTTGLGWLAFGSWVITNNCNSLGFCRIEDINIWLLSTLTSPLLFPYHQGFSTLTCQDIKRQY